MYYEEKVIDGIMHYRGSPHAQFEKMSEKQMTLKILEYKMDIKILQEKLNKISTITEE